jgi:hypothetical protein
LWLPSCASVEARLDEIQAARENGYSADQIAEALTRDGIKINGGTLRSYIQRIIKRREKSRKPNHINPRHPLHLHLHLHLGRHLVRLRNQCTY